ncbi:MAG: HNH endonuclease [Bdellovibrionaceae bacterium]|nr:HNH endonuclease [Bdellovibrionales bacterium]MCB9084506.1 HNH endonuclease [Pseudobdellovibrionaceae bacterium]
MEFFFEPADEAHQKRERAKARELRKSLWWRQQLGRGKCHYCQKSFTSSELTMDHKIPIVRGGMTTKKNVVVACLSCNQEKKYWLPGEQALAKDGEIQSQS